MLNNILIYIMICYKNMALLMQTSFLVVIAQKNLQSNYVKSFIPGQKILSVEFFFNYTDFFHLSFNIHLM